MPLTRLHHYNIWTNDLAATLDFYERVLGLKEGPRPPIPTPGAWAYDPNGIPVLHIYDAPKAGRTAQHGGGALDHIAFEASDYDAMETQIKSVGIPYKTNVVEGVGLRQIFVEDPNGIVVELNFQS